MVSQILAKFNPQSTKQKVAILGHRGIPNNYGGFETLAEKLAEKLVDLGCETTVYCRSNYFKDQPEVYKGAKLIYLPTLPKKSLDTFFHSFISTIHLIFNNTAKTVLMVNVGNAPFALIAKIFGKKVILCVDGLDWERKKWGKLARVYLKACSYLAKYSAHEIVTDATSVAEFYKSNRHAKSTLIPYGIDIENFDSAPEVEGLEPKKYFVYTARFEPENNPLKVVKAYVKSGSRLPLVMIGDNRYNQKFVEKIKRAGNDRVIFLGYVFGAKYKKILKNALAYVRAAEVGGNSPAVIEAMGKEVCVVANDKPENREVIANTGFYYDLKSDELVNIFKEISAKREKAIEMGKRAGQRAMLLYNWDKIAYEYFKIIKKLNYRSAREVKIIPQINGKKRVLIAGGGGMLGEAVYEHFSKNYEVLATDIDLNENWIQYLDVRDSDAYENCVRQFRPHCILHLAALTSLEDCEKDRAAAYLTNALSVKTGAKLSKKYNAKFVYVSSAGVFDGQKEFYTDDEEPTPINTYGLSKQIGALYAKFYTDNALVVRPGWMMGGGQTKDKKFVNAIIKQITAGKKEIFAVLDKFGTPTYTHDLARTMDLLLEKNASGTYNTVCQGFASRYDVACEIVKILGYEKDIKVIPVKSDYFAQEYFANRPASENLVDKKLNEENLNLMKPWQEALQEYLKRDFAYAYKPIAKRNLLKTKLATI